MFNKGIKWPFNKIILLRIEDILINNSRLTETDKALTLIYYIKAKSF